MLDVMALVGQVAVADGLELLQLVLEHHSLLHRVVHLLAIVSYSLRIYERLMFA